MSYQVVFLHQAEIDLQEIKNYLIKNFSKAAWQTSYAKIKKSINTLKAFPQRGSIPPELEELNLSQFQQVISGMNRIIYETRQNIIYIHIVCDIRRDMKSQLTKMLFRVVNLNSAVETT